MLNFTNFNHATANMLQDPIVSGFYGPGAWAAWCIALVASWAPILRDEYDQDLYLISYALYTNWAAMDALQYFSLPRKIGEFDSTASRLIRERPMEVSVVEYAPLNLSLAIHSANWSGAYFWISEGFGRVSNEIICSTETGWYHCQPTEDERQSRLQKERTLELRLPSLRNHTHQSKAAEAVLNLGTLHAFAQLSVCVWKTTKHARSKEAKQIRRRNLIIFLGLILPSAVHTLDDYGKDFSGPARWAVPSLWTGGFLFATAYNFFCDNAATKILPRPKSIFTRVIGSLSVIIFARSVGRYAASLKNVLSPRSDIPRGCLLMPCTASKITELDQAFALFAALSYLVYDFEPLAIRLFKFLKSYYEKLFPQAQPHHATWAGRPIELPRWRQRV